MLERLWRKRSPHSLLVGMYTGRATMENSMEFQQKIRNRATTWPSNPSSSYLPPQIGNVNSQSYTHPFVDCSIIHGGQDKDTTEVSLNRWLGSVRKPTVQLRDSLNQFNLNYNVQCQYLFYNIQYFIYIYNRYIFKLYIICTILI